MTPLKDAYTTQELAAMFGVAIKNILARAKREAWHPRPRQGRGGGNEWLVDSMSAATRLKLANALVAAQAREAEKKAHKQAVSTPLEKLPANKRDRAEARALAARMANGFMRSGGLRQSAAYELFAQQYNSRQIDVPEWARAALPRISRASLVNWNNTINSMGVTALAGKHGQHRKGKGALDQPYVQEFCLAHIYRWPHAGASQIHKGLEARLALQKRPEKLPSLRRVQDWLKGWCAENRELLTFVSNPDAWRNKFRVSFGDADGLVWALNQEWEMDSTPSDLILADGKRHTIVACIDLYSRRVTFHVSRTSTSHAVATCLRKSILAWGVPDTVRTDNGQDYVSRHIERVLLDMDISHDVCNPFSPEEKPFVERVFKSFLHDNLELLTGFTGHNVSERKALEARKSFAQRMFEKDARVELRLSADELQKVCDSWANDTYMHRKHSKLECTPYEKARAYEGEIRRVENENALRLLFLPCADKDGGRTVTKKGVQAFNDHYYAPALALHVGQRVQVRVDDADYSQVHVYSLDGTEFICTARGCKHGSLTQAEIKNMAASAKRQQKEQRSEGVSALVRASKNSKVENIAYERMQHDAERARRIEAEQPLRAELMGIHSTPALEGAAEATRVASHRPAPMTAEQIQAQERARAELQNAANRAAKSQNHTESKAERFAWACAVERAMASGTAISPEDARRLHAYKQTAEYSAQKRMNELFGNQHLAALAS